MAATEGRVAKHERRWGCRRGTLPNHGSSVYVTHSHLLTHLTHDPLTHCLLWFVHKAHPLPLSRHVTAD